MRVLIAIACVGGCATSRICPSGSNLVSKDSSAGRTEWCATQTNAALAMPVPAREYTGRLGMARPSAISGRVNGPFTHWHPNGMVESHGHYMEAGDVSVPDGVWAFWGPTGSPRAVGRYDRGVPVGCFFVLDEGRLVTGIVEGDQLRVEACTPPADDFSEVEKRSRRHLGWGDVATNARVQTGDFGARNSTQVASQPVSRATFEGTLRKQLGRFRVGPSLGFRLSDTDDARAYTASAVGAIGLPLRRRLTAELETRLGIQYLEVTARRTNVPGTAGVHFWAPLAAARASLALAATPRLQLVAGVGAEGWFHTTSEQSVRYCAPTCGPSIAETWTVGGISVGIDLGLRVLIR